MTCVLGQVSGGRTAPCPPGVAGPGVSRHVPAQPVRVVDIHAHARRPSWMLRAAFLHDRCPWRPVGLAFTMASVKRARCSPAACSARKARLADAGMDDARLLGAELDLAGLDGSDRTASRPSSPCRDAGSASGRADPRILPSRPTMPHHVGGRDAAVEGDVAAPAPSPNRSSAPDHVSAGGNRLLGLRRRGRTRRPAAPSRCRSASPTEAAHHLVGMARVDAEVERHLDRLVELGAGVRLHHPRSRPLARDCLVADAVEASRTLAAHPLVPAPSLSPPPR